MSRLVFTTRLPLSRGIMFVCLCFGALWIAGHVGAESPAATAALQSETPVWTMEGDQGYARLGYTVSSAGDVNGDDYVDIIVGSYLYDNPIEDGGAVHVFYGSPTGPGSTPDWVAYGDQSGSWFSNRAVCAGDVNGDEYDDIIVSAQRYDNPDENEGKLFVYMGGPSGLSPTPAWSVEGGQEGANLVSISGGGDVNDDGFDDVVVGALFYNDGAEDDGKVWCYLGGPSGLASTPVWTASGDQAFAYFGYDVAVNGDVNNDGYSDVLVGARGPHEELPDGRVFAYYGGASGPSSSPDWVGDAGQWDAGFGGRVEYAGDVNGDNYSDVIIGATGYDNGETNEGGAFVYHGGPSGLSEVPDWIGESNQEDSGFGGRVAGAGDIDGDGYDDVLVAAIYFDDDQVDEGRVYAFFGSSSGLESGPGWTVDGNQNACWMGVGLSGAGDQIAGDNLEVLLGAPLYNSGSTDEGVAFIFEVERSIPPTPPAPAPTITSIVDHPQDQGKQVILSWEASEYDVEGRQDIIHYSVWRRYQGGGAVALNVSEMAAGSAIEDELVEMATNLAGSGWEYVADQDARYFEEYALTAPTYADSTASGIPYTGYIVIAHTYDRWTFYTSAPDSGYSVDNIPPETPLQLAGEYLDGTGVVLNWEANVESDISHYAVYRSEMSDFKASDLNLLGTSEEALFVDGDFGDKAYHYKVSAYDKNGNEGPPALLAADEIENNPWSGRTYSDLLFQNVPNPFLTGTDIAFTTSTAGHIRLTIYDAIGRKIRVLVDSHRPPSRHVEVWDGRDDSGRPVASGAYFYLLEAPGWRGGKKMMLAR